MTQEEYKLKKQMASKAVADFLRELAEASETESNGAIVSGELADMIRDYNKVTVTIKRKSDQATIKVKVKKQNSNASLGPDMPAPQTSTKDNRKPKYKALKKRMQATFKSIQASLDQNRLPTEELVDQFSTDSQRMVTYPGKGDPEYAAYTQAVANLTSAYQQKDYHRFKSTFENLNRQKKRCHSTYK